MLPVMLKATTSGLERMIGGDLHLMASKKFPPIEVVVTFVHQGRIRRENEAKVVRATLSPFLELGFALLGLTQPGRVVGLQIYAMMPGQA